MERTDKEGEYKFPSSSIHSVVVPEEESLLRERERRGDEIKGGTITEEMGRDR